MPKKGACGKLDSSNRACKVLAKVAVLHGSSRSFLARGGTPPPRSSTSFLAERGPQR